MLTTHTPVVAQILLKNLVRPRGRGGEKFRSKMSNSGKNGKIDLLCISVWGGTGLYYCHQIDACLSSKIFATA